MLLQQNAANAGAPPLVMGSLIATIPGVAISYTDGLNQESFVASGLNYDATLRNLELIGEVAMHIPDSVRVANPQIPWRLVIATRNRLIHGYLGIDNDTLYRNSR